MERRVPLIAKITQHPRYKDWVPAAVAALEVGGSLLVLWVVVPWLLTLLSKIPFPHIQIPWPHIPLPAISLPDWQLPALNLPDWLARTLYWLNKTLPIWLAVGFAIYEVRKRNKPKT